MKKNYTKKLLELLKPAIDSYVCVDRKLFCKKLNAPESWLKSTELWRKGFRQAIEVMNAANDEIWAECASQNGTIYVRVIASTPELKAAAIALRNKYVKAKPKVAVNTASTTYAATILNHVLERKNLNRDCPDIDEMIKELGRICMSRNWREEAAKYKAEPVIKITME